LRGGGLGTGKKGGGEGDHRTAERAVARTRAQEKKENMSEVWEREETIAWSREKPKADVVRECTLQKRGRGVRTLGEMERTGLGGFGCPVGTVRLVKEAVF